jgi:glycosyltransferase involved in cell wall biosynthesis
MTGILAATLGMVDLNACLFSGASSEAVKEARMGMLDGITIFRYAHIYRTPSAGGMENYLKNLDRQLLERNRIRVLQMYLTSSKNLDIMKIQKVGRGEIIWLPSFIKYSVEKQPTIIQKLRTKLLMRMYSDYFINHDYLLRALESYEIDLAAFHWISEDSIVILRYLKNKKIPFVVINHFNNARLEKRISKKYISEATVIGGVSSVNIPASIKGKYTNLSDEVDTKYYNLKNAVPLDDKIKSPLILMPSRIAEGKGHVDAVHAIGNIVRQGLQVKLALAGRVENPNILEKVKGVITSENLDDQVIFLGELTAENLRNWYAACHIVLLTSYSEGLGRVLLEAQAMKRAVVAYDAGGVSEAVEHGVGGYLVKIGDIEGLSKRLKELLEQDEIRNEMGCRGERYIMSRFATGRLAARHEEFYRQAITNSKLR